MIRRRLLGLLLALAVLVPVVTSLCAAPAIAAPQSAAQQQAITREEAIRQLAGVRASIDQTLELVKQGDIEQAYAQARTGYLNHFEYVEVALRVVAPDLTADAETKFAEIRGLIKSGAPVDAVRTNIVELRRLIDDAERRLTDTGFDAVAVVAGQSFLIIFREGLEAVLLLTALLGYLEATKATRYRRPIAWGVGIGLAATAVTYLILRFVLSVLPVGREVLEAVVAIAAVAVLLYISFWLIARLEHRRWMEFLRSRLFNAVSVGSTTALVLVGFTAMYREELETALLYQALVEFGQGLGWWILVGLAAGLAALAVVSYLIFRLGRRLPVKTFLVGAVVLLMATSVAFLGNAVRSLQTADLIGLTPLSGVPRAPIFLSQALGYWPSMQTLVSQVVLVAVYAVGAVWLLMGAAPPGAGGAMGVRVGADVGGTFTKAVAIDSVTGELAGRAVVPTTHDHRDGVSAGVVDVVAKLVAEVAGALRIGDGVIVEVGGTSTNVAAITAGRPALSYVRVAGQATAVRALDVRVAGVAGGSMLRVRQRRIYGVGPRSAHIAGLTYSCFLAPGRLSGARPETLAPRPGDPADYLALRLADGTLAALTNTCAANALGLVADGDYAAGHRRSATAALDIAGAAVRLSGSELARRMMQASTEALADLVTAVAAAHRLTQPTLIAVGGGASVLGRPLAGILGPDCQIPPAPR